LGEQLARDVTDWTGRTSTFLLALASVVVWALLGPLFRFSDSWQLVINTATNVITLLMVFLIQRAQNKDATAIHLKLNEVVAALDGASNRLINVEDCAEEELETLRVHYTKLVTMAKRDGSLTRSHSIEEAEVRHRLKHQRRQEQHMPAMATAPASTGAPPADNAVPQSR
jgi:low affinity Fe/Cu permease